MQKTQKDKRTRVLKVVDDIQHIIYDKYDENKTEDMYEDYYDIIKENASAFKLMNSMTDEEISDIIKEKDMHFSEINFFRAIYNMRKTNTLSKKDRSTETNNTNRETIERLLDNSSVVANYSDDEINEIANSVYDKKNHKIEYDYLVSLAQMIKSYHFITQL